MTTLVPMRPEVYPVYLEAAMAAYAEDNVAAGRSPRVGALEISRREFAALLPAGLATPDHYLYEIFANSTGPSIGAIWFAIDERHGLRSAFVYDVKIEPAWRRQGHATRAFRALEPIVTGLGLTSIGLHVFPRNVGAQALYARLGYQVTGINLARSLSS